MAIIYFAYLFDAEAFRQAMMPIVYQLEIENYEPLRHLAKEAMESHPDLWPILDSLFLGPPFAEEGEQPTPRRSLMMVLAQFLRPVSEFTVSEGLAFLEVALPRIGWSDEEIKLLTHGKSLCELLVPGRYNLSEYKGRPQDLPWCTGYAGWLDVQSVIMLKNKMVQSQEAYQTFVQQSPEVARLFNIVKKHLNFPKENLLEKSSRVWENLLYILESSHKSQKAVAMTVAW